MSFSTDLAITIGMLAGWLALIVAIVWQPGHRCENAYCPHRTTDPRLRRRGR